MTKKGKRKVQGVPQSQTAALPRHREEEETDKTKQAQIKIKLHVWNHQQKQRLGTTMGFTSRKHAFIILTPFNPTFI